MSCLCVCVCNAYLSNRLLLSAEISNTGRSQCFMKTKFGRIAIKGFIFELWHDLLAWTAVARVRASFSGLPSETILSTAGYIALDL